jgi:hypothetical protein
MTLEEIFKTNPKLLEEPEVKKLIEYADTTHSKTANLCKKYQDFHYAVFDIVSNSEIVVINGQSCEHGMNDILKLL